MEPSTVVRPRTRPTIRSPKSNAIRLNRVKTPNGVRSSRRLRIMAAAQVVSAMARQEQPKRSSCSSVSRTEHRVPAGRPGTPGARAPADSRTVRRADPTRTD